MSVEITLRGIGVSPGIAIGPAFSYHVSPAEVPKHTIDDAEAEIARFTEATASVREDINALRAKTVQEAGEESAKIFDAHLMILQDVQLINDVESRVTNEMVNVEHVVEASIRDHSTLLERLEDTNFRERAIDVRDVGRRIVDKLLHLDNQDLHNMGDPSIVVAHDLTPSDTANLDLANTLALACDLGGATSHMAILARAFELPAVVGLKRVGWYTYPNDPIIVDGTEGVVIVRPEPATRERYLQKKAAEDAQRHEAAETTRFQESITIDGIRVPLRMNIEIPAEIDRGMQMNPDGVGLFRTEFLYINRSVVPSEEEQYRVYSTTVDAVKPHGVTFRTLDLGGDKFARGLQMEAEPNPQLGWRAIRFCLERTDIFRAQLRALYRASAHGPIQIMFPLISGLEDWRKARDIALDVQEELADDGISFRRDVPLGVMIEVPSAVIMAEQLAQECAFFSIGTNDLVQYVLAVDRVNEKIAHLFEQAHPAVLRAIQTVVNAAKTTGIPVTVCGEMGGNPIFTELLIGMGVDALSMSSVSIPEVRSAIAACSMDSAQQFAQQIVSLTTAPDVKRGIRERYEARSAPYWNLSQFERISLEGNNADSDS